MKVIKIIIIQAFWYITVVFGHQYQQSIFFFAIILSVLNYLIYKPKITKGHYLFTIFFFTSFGAFQEVLFEILGLVSYHQDIFPLWLSALYIVFIGYYGDLFNYLSTKSKTQLFFIGALGGASSYYGGAKLSPIEVLSINYYFAVAVSWGIFFPLSIKVFYESYIWSQIQGSSKSL